MPFRFGGSGHRLSRMDRQPGQHGTHLTTRSEWTSSAQHLFHLEITRDDNGSLLAVTADGFWHEEGFLPVRLTRSSGTLLYWVKLYVANELPMYLYGYASSCGYHRQDL